MKKYLSIILSIFIILSLVSCGNDTPAITESDYIYQSSIPLSGIKLDTEPDSLAVYKNIAFILADGNVTRLDILTGDTSVILEDKTAIAVGCDGSRIAVIAPSTLSIYDYDGESLKQIPLETEVTEIADIAIGGSGVVFADGSKPSNIYYADLKTEKVTLLPDTWKLGTRDASVHRLSLTANGTLRIGFIYNFSFAGYDFRTLEYDINGDEILSTSEAGVSAQYGCFGADGEFYYVENYISGTRTDASWNQFVSKISGDGTSLNVMLIDNEGLKNLGIEPQETHSEIGTDVIEEYTFIWVVDRYSLEYADGESFVIWNQTANTLAAFNTNSELDALVLLVPDEYTRQGLNELIVKYTAKTGRQVVTKSYPKEEYDDRLRTKLLAGESDFDLFISETELLRSILENTAYQPLDGYESLTANFDNVLAEGARELMTADGGLFGVPMRVHFWGCLKQTGDYEVPQDWTTEELFELCDNIPDGKRVYGDRFMLTRTVFNYVEDMVQKDGSINKQELSDFFGRLKEYNDSGVLCDGDNESLLTYGAVFFSSGELIINDVENQIMTIAPTRSGTKYIDLDSTMLMNRSSENKDAAAEFLALMTSEEVVYNDSDFDHLLSLIGRDVERNSRYNRLTESEKEVLEYSMSMYQNSKPSFLHTIENFSQFIADIVNRLFDGGITPDEAAQKIIDEVAYTYFE